MHRSLRSAVALVLGLLVALVTALLPISPAVAAGTATIGGIITNSADQPVADVRVDVYQMRDRTLTGTRFSTATDAEGRYQFSGVEPGRYTFAYNPQEYAREVWNNEPTLATATFFDIVASTVDTVDTTYDVVLQTGKIIGFVGTETGKGIGDVLVEAHRVSETNNSRPERETRTNPDGSFELVGLATDSYKLRFLDQSGRYLEEWWADKGSEESADPIAVNVNDSVPVSGIGAALAPRSPASIGGTVRNADGTPASGAVVSAYARATPGATWVSVKEATTNSSGSYTIGGLPADTFRLGFALPGAPVSEYWDDVTTVALADDIVVGTGQNVTGRDAVLGVAGGISGTVTGPAGAALSGPVTVTVWTRAAAEVQGAPIRSTTTDVSGKYRLRDLPAGDYRLGFSDGAQNYLPEFWSDQATLGAAADIAVQSGVVTTSKDAELAQGGAIAGTVSVPSGHDVTDVVVTAYQNVSGSWEYVTETRATASGGYALEHLAGGIYRIGFADDHDDPAVVPLDLQYWNGATTLSTATDISVTGGTTTGPRNATLVAVPYKNMALPTITGTPEAGQVLTAAPGTWSPTGATYAYQWLADGVAFGATDKTVILTDSEVDARISVEVTASGPGGRPASAVSGETTTVTQAPYDNEVLPTITGTPEAGQVLTAAPGTWSPTGATFAYQWLADGVAFGATGPTVTLTDDEVGARIRVEVTASGPDGRPASEVSAATSTVVRAPYVNTVLPTVVGTPQVGEVLSAGPGTWSPTGASYAFEWLADGVAFGSTGNTLTVTEGLVGRRMSVRVTASGADRVSAVGVSGQTVPVAAAPVVTPPVVTPPVVAPPVVAPPVVAPGPTQVTNPSAPRITGKLKVGKVVKVSRGTWSPSTVTLKYQWLANGKKIKKATKAKFTIAKAQVGKKLQVRVTASAPGLTAKVVTTKPTAKIKA